MSSRQLPSSSSSSSSVSVECDPCLRSCSICLRDVPSAEYSGAQLKKKGKRVCKQCVEKKEKQAADEAEHAALEAQFAKAVPMASSAHAGQKVVGVSSGKPSANNSASSSSTPSSATSHFSSDSCVECYKASSAKLQLKQCRKCNSAYCSLDCLKKHTHISAGQKARTVNSLEPCRKLS
jgi:hypothetical protein